MYKVVLRSNLILFVVVLALAAGAVICIPQFFPENVLEVPSVALFAGEVGLSLLLALLFYESARTEQAIGLAATMFGFSMTMGAVCNFVCQATQMLPDDFVLVSWLELLIMNLAGLAATVCLFRLEPTDEFKFITMPAYRQTADKPKAEFDAVRRPAPKQALSESPPAPFADESKAEDFTPPVEVSPPVIAKPVSPQQRESAKEILEKLDIARINNLEQQLHPTDDALSLDNLFKDEKQASSPVAAAEADHLLEVKESAVGNSAPNMVASTEMLEQVPAVAFDPNNLAEIDKLFDDIEIGTKAVPVNPVVSQVTQQPAAEPNLVPDELKEFARLATTDKNINQPIGTMRTIGKMLLDVKAVENIINTGQQMGFSAANARAISQEDGEEIEQFLKEIDGKTGVVGSLIVGHDGLVVAATLGEGLESFSSGALSMAIYNHTRAVTKRLGLGQLRQTILQSAQTVAVLTLVSRGVLVVIADSNELGPLSGLLNAINLTLEKQVD